jgi:hypothetical protein
MSEHPIEQPIYSILVVCDLNSTEEYRIGVNGVTRIEATTKSGLHADLPYVRVWKGAFAHSEFCQHSILGVYFELTSQEPT